MNLLKNLAILPAVTLATHTGVEAKSAPQQKIMLCENARDVLAGKDGTLFLRGGATKHQLVSCLCGFCGFIGEAQQRIR